MQVLKFGGTSVGSVESIKQVIEIIDTHRRNGDQIAVVFSAMGGITNQLIEIGRMAISGEPDYMELVRRIEDRHFNVVKALIPVKEQGKVVAHVRGIVNELEDLLRGVSLIRELTPRTHDLITSFGERLSTTVITECVRSRGIPAQFCDARQLIKTDAQFGHAEVNYTLTNELIQDHFAKNSDRPGTAIQMITGFIGSTEKNETTTLGRGGSDYTASIIGAALNADIIDIWTDVDGMMTADPRKVPNAFNIPTITYAEAMELSHFGAKVIYPPSLQPAFAQNIPVRVLNTFNPTHEGTVVSRTADRRQYTITGISSIDDIALVNLQGSGMIGVAGVSAKLFGVLAAHKISVILISQASSEHSICFAIDPRGAEEVKAILDAEFATEIEQGHIDSVAIERDLSVIATVGEGMKKSSGIAGKLFSVLGKNGVNIVAVAQGSSEINISVVINRNNLSKALNALHNIFFQSEARVLNLYLVGIGLIGKTLLKQIFDQSEFLRSEKLLKVCVVGMTNTKKMVLDPQGISLNNWHDRLLTEGVTTSLPAFVEKIKDYNLPNSVFIDCTSDKDIVQFYESLLDANISVVTPNKVANSGPYSEYRRLQRTALNRGVKFLYETNVGAGLPIINTVQGLITVRRPFSENRSDFIGYVVVHLQHIQAGYFLCRGGAGSQRKRLHRTRPARRPERAGCSPQDSDSGPRSRFPAGARRRDHYEYAARVLPVGPNHSRLFQRAGTQQRLFRKPAQRSRSYRRKTSFCGQFRERKSNHRFAAGGTGASILSADGCRQHRFLHDRALQRPSPRGERPRCRCRSDGLRRIRRCSQYW